VPNSGNPTPTAAPITPEQAMREMLDGPELQFHHTEFSDLDPQTMRVTDLVVEHRTANGTEIKQVTSKKVRGCEGYFSESKQIVGSCSETGLPAVKLLHCANPECARPVCLRHAVALPSPESNAQLQRQYVCRACFTLLQFQRNLWNEFDSQQGRF
jgi:hypothetical protein